MSTPSELDRLVRMDDFEQAARERLPQDVYDYYAGGAGDERTLRANREGFADYELLPRVLVDVSRRDLATTVLGADVSMPVLIAPTAFQRMADPDGEVATARAAAAAGTVMTLSTIASSTIEEVAEVGGARWFQLYVYKDRGVTEELVKRAVASGYTALVLTVDTPVLGLRDRDARNRFVLPDGVELANLAGLGAGTKLPSVAGSGLFAWVAELQDASVTWDDVAWLRSISDIPVILKGVLAAADAEIAVEHGIDGIVVSNHGGRQLDGSPATIRALPEVVAAVDGSIEVFVDGGIRRGSDIVIALGLGARAVLLGRPILWGLAAGGQAGVTKVLDIIRDELDVALAIAGCPSVAAVGPETVRRRYPHRREETTT